MATDTKTKKESFVPVNIKISKQKTSLLEEWSKMLVGSPNQFFGKTGENGKRLLRFAFSGSEQEVGPYPIKTDDALSILIPVLISHMNDSWDERWSSTSLVANDVAMSKKSLGERLEYISDKSELGFHSHPGKYVHPSAKERWVQSSGNEQSTMLCSRSAGAARWLSVGFSHAPEMTDVSFCLYANFELSVDGETKVSCLCVLLAQAHPVALDALRKLGVSDIFIELLVNFWRNVFSNSDIAKGSELPTLLWPKLADGVWRYDALTALPALAVFNALKRMDYAAKNLNLALKKTTFSVGSGQAQNISVAATHSGGAITALVCAPPRLRVGALDKMVARTHSKFGLLGKHSANSAKELGDSAISMKPWPNENRRKKLKYLASRHVGEVFWQLEDLLGEIQLDASIADRIGKGAVGEIRSVLLGGGVSVADRGFWLGLIFDEASKLALSAHSTTDQDYYKQCAWASIQRSLA